MEPFKPGDEVEVRFWELVSAKRGEPWRSVEIWLPGVVAEVRAEGGAMIAFPSGRDCYVPPDRLRRPSTSTTEAQP